MNLTAASRQWASRPAPQRFTSLTAMAAKARLDRDNSRAKVISTRKFALRPADESHKGLLIEGQNGSPAMLTHYSFGQISALAKAPAGYLRTLPSEIVADNLNYGLRFNREAEDVGVLLTRVIEGEDGDRIELRAATGPNYGRVWNSDVIDAAVDTFGDGTRESGGRWQVPGEFRRQVPITQQNTTFYYGDESMFLFLADEQNGIQIANRRGGQHGDMARGIFIWNSEVGDETLGMAMFLYDYTCMNRIVWGVRDYREIKIRHTASAPDKWVEQVAPVIEAYAESSAKGIEETIAAAQKAKVDQDMDAFLKNRFTKPQATAIKIAHEREEGRPMETLWDVATGITAMAKTIAFQSERVAIERKAGEMLDLAERWAA